MEARNKKRNKFLTFLLSYDLFSRHVFAKPVMCLCGQPEFFHSQEYIVYAQQLLGLLFNDDIKSRLHCLHLRLIEKKSLRLENIWLPLYKHPKTLIFELRSKFKVKPLF
jgi:hypothetical protein